MPKLTEIPFFVLDTETTGADPSKDKPIELAYVKVQKQVIDFPKSWFIDPQCLVPPEASSIHHIVDEDLIGAPTWKELWPLIEPELKDQVIVAHNAPFDISMIPELKNNPVIDTLRVAKHLWPKGTLNHKNQPLMNHQQQTIRYWLGLKIDTMGLAAHRAAADILVTAQLLLNQINLYLECGGDDDLDSFIEFYQQPIEITHMAYGKYSGKALKDIPSEYLEYLVGNKDRSVDFDLSASIKRELDSRKAEIVIQSRNKKT